MARRFVGILAAASFALCVATVFLWVRSYRAPAGQSDRAGWFVGGTVARRFTVRSEAGRVRLFAPPAWNPAARPTHGPRSVNDVRGALISQPPMSPYFHEFVWEDTRPLPPPVLAGKSLRDLLAELDTDQVFWAGGYRGRGDPPECHWVAVAGSIADLLGVQRYPIGDVGGYPTWSYGGTPWHDQTVEPVRRVRANEPYLSKWAEDPPVVGDADLNPGLLAAFEDPSRFGVAHLLLCRRTTKPEWRRFDGYRWVPSASGGGVDVDGLRFTLPRPAENKAWVREGNVPLRVEYTGAVTARPDPAHGSRLLDVWHQRLDAEIGSLRDR